MTVIDFSELKRVGIALRESKDLNTALLKAIPDMMLIQNQAGVYIDYHASKFVKTYVAPEFFLGKNMSEILPENLYYEFKPIFEAALRTGLVQTYEYSLPTPNGKEYFECRVVAYEHDKILSLIRNITELTISDQSNWKLRNILKNQNGNHV